jgi:hypothetical protein
MSDTNNQSGDAQNAAVISKASSTYLKIFNNVRNLDIFNPKNAGSGYLPH